MSTVDLPRKQTIPPLIEGQRLDRASFHERYEAMPPGARFELIGGVVVMPSPVGRTHGDFVRDLAGWTCHYSRRIKALTGGSDSTVFLDAISETQPDLHLRIKPEYGGHTHHEGKFIAGAPELVVEVSASSKANDLGPKFEDYRRCGVLEYLVVTCEPEEIHWFVRRGDQLESLPPGVDGLYRSEVFPGLWLDPIALFSEDLDSLFGTLDRGLATPEYAAFAAELISRGPKSAF